jgi:hypothetical protein
VAKGDLLLIVEPVLIVGAEAGVEYPLLESQIALGEVVGQGFVLWRASVASEIWNSCDDSAAPVFYDLFGLVCEYGASLLEIALIFFRETYADF